ncbi:LamG domain-containing protein [bacterium]|nr:LamG domain-containing protein [bacterium]
MKKRAFLFSIICILVVFSIGCQLLQKASGDNYSSNANGLHFVSTDIIFAVLVAGGIAVGLNQSDEISDDNTFSGIGTGATVNATSTVSNASEPIHDDGSIIEPVSGNTTVPANGTSTTTVRDDLISYWPFDTNANDSEGNNNGVVHGATLTTGKNSGAYNFVNNDDYISFDDQSSFSFTDGNIDKPFSISVWVYRSSDVSGWGTLVSKFGGPSGLNREFVLRSGYPGTTHRLDLSLTSYNSGVANISAITNNDISLNEWVHVIVTYDGSATPQGIKFYQNGTEMQASYIEDTNYVHMNNLAAPLRIGAMDSGSVINSITQVWNGSIDEVAIWNKTLSAAEIIELYTSSNTGNSYFD